MALTLTSEERRILRGEAGPATQFALELIVSAAQTSGAKRLQAITQAHVVEPLIYGVGKAVIDFARHLAGLGARVVVPSTLGPANVDGTQPHCNLLSGEQLSWSREIMAIYENMGCTPTYSCAPYLELNQPLRLGEHVAWGESNAVSFANSVYGARTNRYGNFIGIAAALAGRVPADGLHLEENRRPTLNIGLAQFDESLIKQDLFWHLLGYFVGRRENDGIPALTGVRVQPTLEAMKAFGASAASSGAIAMYHIAGVTPEAMGADFSNALERLPTVCPTLEELDSIRRELSTARHGDRVTCVSIGAPQMSIDEIAWLVECFDERKMMPRVPVYIAVGRKTLSLAAQNGLMDVLQSYGVKAIADRCTYYPGILNEVERRTVVTNSAKWAHYGPGCINARVHLTSIRECVASAISGIVDAQTPVWRIQ